jgi:hypothetical protein
LIRLEIFGRQPVNPAVANQRRRFRVQHPSRRELTVHCAGRTRRLLSTKSETKGWTENVTPTRFAMGAITSVLIGLTTALAPTSAAVAAPADTPPAYEKAPDPGPDLPRKIAEYTTDYKEVGEPGSAQAAADGLPSGCSLTVIVYQWSTTIKGSVMTKCAFTVAVIENNATLSRSRWFGWENVATDSDHGTLRATMVSEIAYDCTHTGTHDFKLIGSGNLTKDGRHYYAAAYDQVNAVNCN